MPVQTSCPHCKVPLQLLEARPGVPLSCPKCRRTWTPSQSDLCQVSAQLTLACPKCWTRHTMPPNAGGQFFLCKGCKVRVAAPMGEEIYTAEAKATAGSDLSIKCRQCHRVFLIPSDRLYFWTACPGCSLVAIARPSADSGKPPKPVGKVGEPLLLQLPPSASIPPPRPIRAAPLPLQSLPRTVTEDNSLDTQPLSLDDDSPHRRRFIVAGAALVNHCKLWLQSSHHRGRLVVAGAALGAIVLSGLGVWLLSGNKPSAREEKSAKGEDRPLTGEQVYRRLLYSSTLIASPHGGGSGFVVNAEKRLIVTNYHVVGNEPRVAVVFPLYDDKSELISDARQYEPRIKEAGFRGEVIARDTTRDLAIIRIERLPDRTFAIPLATRPAETGSVVYSVGGSGADDNLLWRLTKGTVRGRGPRRQAADFGVMDCMILETDAPVNPGDSGGPVMNDRGELVAVVSHFNTRQRLVSGNIDAEEVRQFVSSHIPSR